MVNTPEKQKKSKLFCVLRVLLIVTVFVVVVNGMQNKTKLNEKDKNQNRKAKVDGK